MSHFRRCARLGEDYFDAYNFHFSLLDKRAHYALALERPFSPHGATWGGAHHARGSSGPTGTVGSTRSGVFGDYYSRRAPLVGSRASGRPFIRITPRPCQGPSLFSTSQDREAQFVHMEETEDSVWSFWMGTGEIIRWLYTSMGKKKRISQEFMLIWNFFFFFSFSS